MGNIVFINVTFILYYGNLSLVSICSVLYLTSEFYVYSSAKHAASVMFCDCF